MNRRSSLYSLRVATYGSRDAEQVLKELLIALNGKLGRPATDKTIKTEDGELLAVVGFRARNDEEARAMATTMASGYPRTTLLTGFGAARRTIQL